MWWPRLARSLVLATLLAGARARGAEEDRPLIAVFAGPTATILNTDPPVTSRKAREKYGLPPLRDWWGRAVATDTLYPQRLAAPVTVYVEQFSAHPLEADAARLFGPPDGYLDASNAFHAERRAAADRPVYAVELRPEDGLYPLPYMARRADGSAWDGAEGGPGEVRQTFFPDASRLFEELERAGSVLNGNLSGRARFAFVRAVPPGGYTQGLPAARRTDAGAGDLAPEKAGVDFFPYGYTNTYPPRGVLARLTNSVQQTLAAGPYRGAIWLEGSPRVEDTSYWLSLVVDTDCLIAATAAQRPNRRLSADAAQNIVDAVDFILSSTWRDAAGHNRLGAVLVQDQQVLAAREAVKLAARPGGFAALGGHGGVLGGTGGSTLMFVPNRRHGRDSMVRLSQWPASVPGLQRGANGQLGVIAVAPKDSSGALRAEAVPAVELLDFNDWMTTTTGPAGSAEAYVESAVARAVAESPLAGLVAASVQGGHFDAAEVAALGRAALRGVPVVKVFRGMGAGFVYPDPDNLLIEGSNLTNSKARVLLLACLLRFGMLPPAADPAHPTEPELAAVRAKLAEYQRVFDTH